MRKFLIVVLAVALTLSLLALAGCGGSSKDKDSAKQYMQEGDADWMASKTEWDNIANTQSQITSKLMSGDYSILSGTAGQTMMQQFQTSFDKINTNDNAAKDQYNAILALNDVQDYKDYASQMLEVLDLDGQRVMAWESFIQKIAGMVTSLTPGQTLNITQLASDPDLQHITDLQMQIDSMVKSAEQLQVDKKL
jgi:hypothetical protein